MVGSLFAAYPNATALMAAELQVTRPEVVSRFIRYEIAWGRYKKLLRRLEKALNTCVVVSPEKLQAQWEFCLVGLDTPQLELDSGEAAV